VRLETVFRLAPHVQKDVPIVGPEDERLASLLAISAEDDEASLGRFQVSQQFFRRAVQTLGDFGVAIDKPFPSAQYFSPTVGAQMMIDSLLAMLIAIVAILAYVAARFEFRYGIGAIVALVHDVLITIGLLAVFDIRIDLNVVAALLTIVGYSLNDTMVVFDRIRENIRKVEDSLINIVNLSISQTMGRTLLTSFTTMVVVGIILVAGGEGLADFSATLLIGLILGTYSSVFVAAPVLVMLNKGRPADALLEQALLPDESDEPDFSGGEADDGAAGAPKPA